MSALLIFSIYSGSVKTDLVEFLDCLEKSYHIQRFDCAYCIDGPVPIEIESILFNFFSFFPGRHYVIKSQESMGLAYSLNRLIALGTSAQYQFFVRADSDDLFAPDRISIQLDFLSKNPHVDVVGTFAKNFGISNSISSVPVSHIEIQKAFSYKLALIHATAVFRSSFFSKAGLYVPCRTSLIEDLRLWNNGFRAGAIFANIPLPLYYIRVTPEQLRRRLGLRLCLAILFLRIDHVIYAEGLGLICILRSLAEFLGRLLLGFAPSPLVSKIIMFRVKKI